MAQIKIAHMADTHLGYRAQYLEAGTRYEQRVKDIERAFLEVVDRIIAWRPDLVIHAGDVFHQPRPSWSAISTFIIGMRRLEKVGVPTIVIAGNHDTSTLRTEASVFTAMQLALPHITIVHGYEWRRLAPLPGVAVTAVPFGALASFDEPPVVGATNLLVTHGTAPAARVGRRTDLGTADVTDETLSRAWDLTLLGHIHQWQEVRPRVWYSGSTERMGWSDLPATPGWMQHELALEDGQATTVETRHRPIAAREMVTFDPIDCAGHGVDEIAASVAELIFGWAPKDAMVRVKLERVDRLDFKAVERRVRQLVDRKTFSFQLQRVNEAGEDEEAQLVHALRGPQTVWSIPEMFAEYVAMRKEDPKFNPEFEVKGRELLAQAQARVDAERGKEGL